MRISVRWIFTFVAVFAAIPAVAGNVGFLDSERAIKTVKEGQRQLQILDTWATQKSDEVRKDAESCDRARPTGSTPSAPLHRLRSYAARG